MVNNPRGSNVRGRRDFFNNVGYLGMCGHGTIGPVVTLARLGRVALGEHRIEPPVGIITATLHDDSSVSVANVRATAARRTLPARSPARARSAAPCPGAAPSFLAVNHGATLLLTDARELTDLAERIRAAVHAVGYPEVDHVELFGVPAADDADSRSFVLCPGSAYDRSPRGTGTSAKLAFLAADGKLAEGKPWVQESIIGSRFTASYRWLDRATGTVQPMIQGTAFVNGETIMLLHEHNPFC